MITTATKQQLQRRWNVYCKTHHLTQDAFHIFEAAYALGMADSQMNQVESDWASSNVTKAAAMQVQRNKGQL